MCILTMQSMTHAIRAKSVLSQKGIAVSVVSIDPALTAKGCAYGIRFPCEAEERIRMHLSVKNVPFGILIGRRDTSI